MVDNGVVDGNPGRRRPAVLRMLTTAYGDPSVKKQYKTRDFFYIYNLMLLFFQSLI